MKYKTRPALLHGIVGVFKPVGIQPLQVVTRAKLAMCTSGQRHPSRVGHGGTLDEIARGVLVIGIGQGCRQLQSFLDGPKTYRLTGKLGVLTDTLDATGTVVREMPFDAVQREHIESCLPSFVGKTIQTPADAIMCAPWEDASLLQPRMVHISSLELVNFDPPHFTVVVSCGRGFYTRSLIRDIGEKVGCCAHVVDIFRTAQGQFDNPESLMRYDEIDYDRIQHDIIRLKKKLIKK